MAAIGNVGVAAGTDRAGATRVGSIELIGAAAFAAGSALHALNAPAAIAISSDHVIEGIW
jgi:hypothetical protein